VLPFRLGAMIETPSAALMIEEIVQQADAVSIGLNDLTQYTLAADRDDELVEAYHDAMQPAVVRLLRRILLAANDRAKPVTMCGELAGDPALAALMLALGVRRFSVSQVNYRDMRAAIRRASIQMLEPLATELMHLESAAAVRRLVADRLSPHP
jgi:phosphoenolpyruvate-protein kinase (PTS system EI component)